MINCMNNRSTNQGSYQTEYNDKYPLKLFFGWIMVGFRTFKQLGCRKKKLK
jgi:hypothetical protein